MSSKRKSDTGQTKPTEETKRTKRVTKYDREKLICKKKLDALELEESQSKDDRFTPAEKATLLEAYNQNGFQVFQDTKLLHKYLPNRCEADFKGLLNRLRTKLQTSIQDSGVDQSKMQCLSDWERLCLQLMGNFAKDKKVNMDDVFADAILAEADHHTTQRLNAIETDSSPSFDCPQILRSFASMLVGKFPGNLEPREAQISMRLFDHVNAVVDTIDLRNKLHPMMVGTWLDTLVGDSTSKQEMALKGLSELESRTLRCPTTRDIERNRNIEALCLELPKIKRITDVLNPLHVNESLVSSLMK